MHSLRNRIWKVLTSETALVSELMRQHNVPYLVAHLLAARNIPDVCNFLKPRLKNMLQDPKFIYDMDRAVELIYEAIKNNESILIWGDYDVDGISSVSIIKGFFDEIGFRNYAYYIPERKKDGYGLAGCTAEILSDFNVMICVDCGTGDISKVDEARSWGKRVVILDHHTVGSEIPKSDAFVNPKRSEDKSIYKNLSAGGLTFLFVIALSRFMKTKDPNYKEPNVIKYVMIAALSTVCDAVPLVGVNRAIASTGIRMMNSDSKILGLKVLASVIGNPEVTSYTMGFEIGPRINAAGRLAHAAQCVELLTSKDVKLLSVISENLNSLNAQRKLIEQDILDIVLEHAEKQKDDKFIVLAGNNWPVGVIGIIASRVVEKFGKPTIVVSFDGTIGKGSGRSNDVVNLCQHIQNVNHLLINGGGHSKAVGITISRDNISLFKTELENSQIQDETGEDIFYADSKLALSGVTSYTLDSISLLEPFGEENREPIFIVENVILKQPNIFGEKHLSFSIFDEVGHEVKGLMFNYNNVVNGRDIVDILNERCSIVGCPMKQRYGKVKIAFKVIDVIKFL